LDPLLYMNNSRLKDALAGEDTEYVTRNYGDSDYFKLASLNVCFIRVIWLNVQSPFV
jgi:hypothetical protein